jgi:anhydro-N-acetylmuramic acid kinase
MSGSSLDGLDIAFVQLTEVRGKWTFELLNGECLPYPAALVEQLRYADHLSVPEFLRLHTAYGEYIAEQVSSFIDRNNLQHKIHFVSSHGHTVWHEPAAHTTAQIGCGAAIAAHTLLPVITELRSTDVALGGQGAPIVPIADKLLFGDYDFCLNIGGIANITINGKNPVAFDICPANQLLNYFAWRVQQEFDDKGNMARLGNNDTTVFEQINNITFYDAPAPKSLSNQFVTEEVLPHFETLTENNDALHTASQHIAFQIVKAMQPYINPLQTQRMLITGGGAFNDFLIVTLQQVLQQYGDVELIIPDASIVQYKEAIAMALAGVLRWREENNVLSSVTGALADSVNGALWLPPAS